METINFGNPIGKARIAEVPVRHHPPHLGRGPRGGHLGHEALLAGDVVGETADGRRLLVNRDGALLLVLLGLLLALLALLARLGLLALLALLVEDEDHGFQVLACFLYARASLLGILLLDRIGGLLEALIGLLETLPYVAHALAILLPAMGQHVQDQHATPRPWPGGVAFYRSPTTSGFVLDTVLTNRATMGELAFDFYAGQFGWTKTDAMDMGEMGTYQLFAAGASMAILVTAFSLLTDSLRDALDPKLK